MALIIDNKRWTLLQDLVQEMRHGSKVSVAAACFSIYAFRELKKQLSDIDELRFIFTSPAFCDNEGGKEKREFYISRLARELDLYGTEFEVKLRNELTQKAIAHECAEWIRKKAVFKSNISNENMQGFMTVDDKSYAPIQGFTTVDLGCERGNNAYVMIQKSDSPMSQSFLDVFEELWNDDDKLRTVTDQVVDRISVVYEENSPEFIYFVALYNIFSEFLDDISEDVLPNEATGFKSSKIWGMLYNFQKDAALAIINKLEKYNGCILADSVGLGKTYTALAVIKYYENRNKSVLVLCPKKLSDNWNTFKDNYVNNPIASDRLNYDVLFHTDLSRKTGKSNGLDLGRLNWGNYDLVVIDESHNFRNGIGTHSNIVENRYKRLMEQVIRAGVRTKVLMLSATPVNNRFYDLRNQIQLAYEGTPELIEDRLGTEKPVDDIFIGAQKAFNSWSKLPIESRTTAELLNRLDFDFFKLLDSVTIARSRKHIQNYYSLDDVGSFPNRLPPMSLSPHLTDLDGAISYKEIYDLLMDLNLKIYTPTDYIQPSKQGKYVDFSNNINQKGREQGIRRLMSINLLKRLESSVWSFDKTVGRIRGFIERTIADIDSYDNQDAEVEGIVLDEDPDDFDYDDQNTVFFSSSAKVKIKLADMDRISWRRDLEADAENLEILSTMIRDITPERDSKLRKLLEIVGDKIQHPINPGNKKVLIFTAFADTAEYLYENVGGYVKERFGLDTAMVTGSVEGRTTAPGLKRDLNTVLTCFSPVSKDRNLLMPGNKDEIDVLIATDCISEGQNLQDCDFCVNYDIHWNPVRIIQRFGRIDRIGSRNSDIQLVNFWPDITLDDYINLKRRVETRMKISVMTSTGDDDPINAEELGDLEYRKDQLERLRKEVVDIEEMSSGISIMDLGLNEFRLDLLEFIKRHDEIKRAPHGMEAVVHSTVNAPPGVVFILRNIDNEMNIASQNRLHPYYLVYVAESGEVVVNHLSPKELLDRMRLLCKGKSEPDRDLCKLVGRLTNDGRNMGKYAKLLGDAIRSIVSINDNSEIDSLFKPGGTSALGTKITGLDDFELICFLIVK